MDISFISKFIQIFYLFIKIVQIFYRLSLLGAPLRSSLVAEANIVELFREEPGEDLGLRIVGGKDTPLGNIVIQEIVRDSVAARDAKLAPGDHILEVSHIRSHCMSVSKRSGLAPCRTSLCHNNISSFLSYLLAEFTPRVHSEFAFKSGD